MQKYNFFTNGLENQDYQIKKSTRIQKKYIVNKVDINKLLNRVKVSKKAENIKNFKLVCISMLIISTTLLIIF